MKKEKPKLKKLYEEIEIPDSIKAELNKDVLEMKKENKIVKRKLNPLIDLKTDGNKVIISTKRGRKIERRIFGTFRAHIKNMIKGLIDGFRYKLQISNVHFPMNVSYDKAKNELVVKNFLGEAKDRKINLPEDVEVKIDKETIIITSFDIEKAGQAATTIEKGVKSKDKDRRIYQDGIYIIEKPKISYL